MQWSRANSLDSVVSSIEPRRQAVSSLRGKTSSDFPLPREVGHTNLKNKSIEVAKSAVAYYKKEFWRTKTRNNVTHHVHLGNKIRVNLPPSRYKISQSKNLGPPVKDRPLKKCCEGLRIMRDFNSVMKSKGDKSLVMITRLSSILVGTTFKSNYFYLDCTPFVMFKSGHVLINQRPSIRATRLLLEQVLFCNSNADLNRIQHAISRDMRR
jgi:hypothetical protein